jgi:hypothetical protein
VNILTDLRAALEAKEEVVVGEATFDTQYHPLPRKNAALKERRHHRLHALLTDDTIRALLDVAEAAEARIRDACFSLDEPDEDCCYCKYADICRALAHLLTREDADG